MPKDRRALLAIALLAAGIFACSLDIGRPSNPIVEILSPPTSADITVGHQLEVQHRAANAVGVVRVELEVDGQIVGAENSPVPGGQPSLMGILPWQPPSSATHSLTVCAYNRDRFSDPLGLKIIIAEGRAPPTPTPTPYPLGPNIISTSDYNITEAVTVTNERPGTASRISLWVALIKSRDPYQEVFARKIEPSEF